MPPIVIIMGGEMVYILHQRLRAQNVQPEKEKKVLRDVLQAMFSPLFVDELFKPQVMYSANSTKQIFEKLAHSSIMRLNKSSMDKLYDLMTMGLKYQLVSCTHPRQYVHVMMNHLQSMRNLVVGAESKAVHDCIANTEERMKEVYSDTVLSMGAWALLKQSVLRFVQGKKIKVSLFLQRKMQMLDGTLALDNSGKLPPGAELPGVIRMFDGSRMVRQVDFATQASSEGAVLLTEAWDVNFMQGQNLYTIGATQLCSDSVAQEEASKAHILDCLLAIASSVGSTSDRRSSAEAGAAGSKYSRGGAGMGITSSSARAESKMNQALFGASSGSKCREGSEGNTRLASLCPDSPFMDLKGGGADGKMGDEEFGGFVNIFFEEIDGTADAKTMASMLESLDLKDDHKAQAKGGGGGGGGGSGGGSKRSVQRPEPEEEEEEDDLLALMDSVK